MPFPKILTLLGAALIAGFVGATTQPIIIYILPFPNNNNNLFYYLKFLLVSFIISGLYGFIMKWSKLFPHLETYYYNKLGLLRSIYHDGISGLIVQLTIIILLQFIKLINNNF